MADVAQDPAAVAAVLGLSDDEEAYLVARPDIWNKLSARFSERDTLSEQLATAKAECEALTSNFGMRFWEMMCGIKPRIPQVFDRSVPKHPLVLHSHATRIDRTQSARLFSPDVSAERQVQSLEKSLQAARDELQESRVESDRLINDRTSRVHALEVALKESAKEARELEVCRCMESEIWVFIWNLCVYEVVS